MFPLQATKVMLCDMLVRLTAPNQRTAAPAVGSCPSARPPRPCATRDSRSVAGPCFEAKSGVAFRPTLGQRSSLESCWCIAEQWSGAWVLQPASRPEPLCPEAGTGATVPEPQHLQGVSQYLGCWRLGCKPSSGQS